MDAAIIGGLTLLCAAQGLLLWVALARPAQLDVWWGAEDLGERPFFEERPAQLGWLRGALAVGLVIASFLAGAVTAFLGVTR